MTEPDLFKEAQEQDKDGIAVPILQRMIEHPDFADAACLLRGVISGMQWRLADLQERAETERDARQEAHEATKYWEDRARKAEDVLAQAQNEALERAAQEIDKKAEWYKNHTWYTVKLMAAVVRDLKGEPK